MAASVSARRAPNCPVDGTGAVSPRCQRINTNINTPPCLLLASDDAGGTTGLSMSERNIVVRNHARKADARRSTRAGQGTHRQTLQQIEAKPRIATGLTELDRLLGGGLRPGRLTAIAARTAMGKSMLALSIARHTAIRAARPTLVASLEMSNLELGERTMAAESGLPTERIRRRTLEAAEQDVLSATGHELRTAPLHFGGDCTIPTVPDIERECAATLNLRGRLDLIVVDYLGLMSRARPGTPVDRPTEVAEIVAGLAGLAVTFKAAVVIVEQLTRGTELRDDPRPRLSDMDNEQALLGHADTVILLHRNAYYAPHHREGRYDRSPDPELYPAHLFPRQGLPEPDLQPAELHVPLNRHGRTGMVKVGVDLGRARFFDLAPGGKLVSPHRAKAPELAVEDTAQRRA